MATTGSWVAHAETVQSEADVAAFSSEIQAMRFAVKRRWNVTKVPFGMTLAEAIAAETQAG